MLHKHLHNSHKICDKIFQQWMGIRKIHGPTDTRTLYTDLWNNIKHEYLRSRAYICLSLSSSSSFSSSSPVVIQIWPLSRYSCFHLGSLHPRNLFYSKVEFIGYQNNSIWGHSLFKSIFGCTIWRHLKRRLEKCNIEFPIFCRRWNYIFLILFINIILLSLLAAYIVVHSCRLVMWIWHRYTFNDIIYEF